MPTYRTHNTASDLSPSWSNTTAFDQDLSDTGSETDIVVSLTASQIKSGSLITSSGVPNSDSWEDGGTWEVEIFWNTGNMNIRARCRATRLTSTGTIDQQGSYTGYQTLVGISSAIFNPVAPTWSTTEACSHRLAVEIEFENIDTMMTQEVDLILFNAVGSIGYTTTDITENAGSCGGGSTFVPKCIVF